eukprot:NODE_344_length_10554_cov_0.516308.p2 type:complete len:545 gc:universal NODE_344_length_10554_cov_0.516308:3045-4679(+)
MSEIIIYLKMEPLSLELLDKLKSIHTNIKTHGTINSGEIVLSNQWDTLKDLHEPVTCIYLYENKNIWLKKKDKQIADAVFPIELIIKDPAVILHAILQLAYRKNREYDLHCELQDEKTKRIVLEDKIKHFKNDIASTVITPIHAITDNIANLLNEESLSEFAKLVLIQVIENLKNQVSKPDFLHLFEKLTDADVDRETKSWLATEVLRDSPESVSFEMQRNRRRASSLGLLYWKDRKHSFNKSEKSSRILANSNSRFHSIASNKSSPTESADKIEYDEPLDLSINQIDDDLHVPSLKFNSQNMVELADWSFKVWDYAPNQLIIYLIDMFDSLKFLEFANISRSSFSDFCCSIYRGYSVKQNPYHNFHHAFDVVHAGYLLITKYATLFNIKESFAFLTSCLCHDLGHDGRTNIFHISTISPLALLYNDQSPLENYHCHQTFLLLNEHDILSNFEIEDRLEIRNIIIRCILATDLSKHVTVLGKFNEIAKVMRANDKEHRIRCLEVLIKCADISNVIRPIPLARKWGEAIQVKYWTNLGRDVYTRR